MITRITKPRVYRSYLVYDLEWIPGKFSPDGLMPVRLVGVYDGDRYRSYTTLEGFLDHELTSKNRGKWFYAHAGGLADFQFVLEALIKRRSGYRIRASMSGSSAIIVHVSRGKNTWHFVDSFWLLKAKLSKIGEWIGISKGQQDLEGPELEAWFRDAPLAELQRYNEIDCVILFRAIQQFEETLMELGGQLKMTQASCAMELFRRQFLRRDIATSPLANVIAREAYFASRVEVLNRHCQDAWYYDVNSSFPYAMTYPVPGDPKAHLMREMPDHYDDPFLAFCDITVPEIPIPTVPTRVDGRLFFPTGKWSGWLTSVDLELLERTGGKIRRVHESITFEPRDDLRGYVERLYEIRRASKGGFMEISCKFLLNSIYGKFAESEQKSSIEINPPEPKGPEAGWEMLFPGCFVVERTVPIPHMHVPISAHVTAIGRRTLWEYMNYADEIHYCDTDGFSSSEMLQSAEGLGAIKLEKIIERGHYVTQKVYEQTGTDDRGKPLHIVKAKGFSKMTPQRFMALIEGEEVSYRRMARTREILRQQRITPVEREYKKRLRDALVPKRCFYPDGHSRPWDVEELRSISKDCA